MEYIITAVWIIIEVFSLYIFLSAFLAKQHKKRHTAISMLILWAIMFGYSALGLGSFIKQLVTIALATGWSFYIFGGTWHRHILSVVLSYIFSAIFDVAGLYGLSAILGISYSELIWRPLQYTAVVTLAKMLYLLLAYIIYHMRVSHGQQATQNKWTLLTLLFPLASLIVIVIVFHSHQSDSDLSTGAFISSCVLAIANVAILYMIRVMENHTKKETELVLLNQQMDIQEKSISALERSYRDQRKATHEFNHHLQTIHDLLERGEQHFAREYIGKLQGIQSTHLLIVNSRHPIIDAVLNQKYQAASDQGIEMQFQVSDLSEIKIDTTALVVLLSNLLDNAIEACQKLSEGKEISFSMVLEGELFISIKNASLPVKITDGVVETSKMPKEEHGYGLISVHHILHSFNAEYTIDQKDGWFYFAAEIPNNRD